MTSNSPSAPERTCVSGPLDGQRVTVDCEHGFLAADKQAGLAWRYKPSADGTWQVDTNHDNSLIYPQGPTTGERRLDLARLWAAGEQSTIPILAVTT
jgi:hypothetical protein